MSGTVTCEDTATSTEANREDASEGNSHSFLSRKCEVRIDSDKGGRAVVACQAIRKGELIAMWSGRLVDRAALDLLPPALRRFSLQVEEGLYLASLNEHEGADYINHSCDPNAGLSGQISLVALRDIAVGEDISYDYAMSDGSTYDEFPCGCGAETCRGQVSGDDWRRPELWRRYQGRFSPYLQRRIDDLQASELNGRRARAAQGRKSLYAKHPVEIGPQPAE